MPDIYVIADTHFGHKAVINFEKEKRPFSTIEEHDEALVENWNKTVKPTDTVIHLGDVLFGQESFKYLPRLYGLKKLVMGNHDAYPIQRYLDHFRSVISCCEYRGCILTHIPIHPHQFPRYKLNIHGHTHSSRVMLDSHIYGYPVPSTPDPRYIPVSVEHTNLKPVPLLEIVQDAERAVA